MDILLVSAIPAAGPRGRKAAAAGGAWASAGLAVADGVVAVDSEAADGVAAAFVADDDQCLSRAKAVEFRFGG